VRPGVEPDSGDEGTVGDENGTSVGGVALLLVLILAGLFIWNRSIVGRPAADFTLPDTTGSGEVSLASYRGSRVLLVFWSASCGYCRQELPAINAMETELSRKDIRVVAIHLGEGSYREFLQSAGIDLVSVEDADGEVGRAYRIRGVPSLALIGKDGSVERTAAGSMDADRLRSWCGLEKD